MIKSIVYEPQLFSYFAETENGIKWLANDAVAMKGLELEGFDQDTARKLILYARMNQAIWIDVDNFLKSRQRWEKIAVDERDILNLIMAEPEPTGEINPEMIKKLQTEVDGLIGAIPTNWNNVKKFITTNLPKMNQAELKIIVKKINGLKNLLTVLPKVFKLLIS